MADDSFKDYIQDQLQNLGKVECRAMFGGHGLYHRDVFFGILYKDRLYFKTNETTRPKYETFGMKPFKPSAKQTLKNYYEVPVDIVEDGDELIKWAKEAAAAGVMW